MPPVVTMICLTLVVSGGAIQSAFKFREVYKKETAENKLTKTKDL